MQNAIIALSLTMRLCETFGQIPFVIYMIWIKKSKVFFPSSHPRTIYQYCTAIDNEVVCHIRGKSVCYIWNFNKKYKIYPCLWIFLLFRKGTQYKKVAILSAMNLCLTFEQIMFVRYMIQYKNLKQWSLPCTLSQLRYGTDNVRTDNKRIK